METNAVRTSWTPIQKLGFRFIALYLFIFIFPFPLGLLPFIARFYQGLWDGIVPWVGEYILQIPYPITVEPNGSGDTTYNYVQLFCFLSLSLLGALIWTLADRGRPNYGWLYAWLRIGLRYYLGAVMLSYGFAKVIPTQFPFPDLIQLIQPLGDFSPMGLAWSFMGYSIPYSVFAGLGELIGGLLLFFRRTTLLGALILMGVMSNVVIMNFSYDIPVKIYSSHLLLMATFLAAHDWRRLLSLFLLNRPAPAADLSPPVEKRSWKRIGLVFKTIFIAALLLMNVVQNWKLYQEYGRIREKPPLYGLYEVREFVRNGRLTPPSTEESARWRYIAVSWPGFARIRMMNDSVRSIGFEPDTVARRVEIYPPSDTSAKSFWSYERPTEDSLVLSGSYRGDSLSIRMSRRTLNDFLLVRRGFHWINEYPYNR